MTFIYVLQLKQNKFYVGKTETPDKRLKSHNSGSGSAWTKKYKPLKTIELFEGDKYDEDKYVLKYMDKYGIDNVRGGSYSKVNLTKIQLACLDHISKASNDKCFKCNQPGHFASKCHHNRHKEFLNASSNFESADEIEVETGEDSDEDSEEEITIESLEETLYELDKNDGIYELDGVRYFWENGSGLFEESDKTPGHRDGTFGNQYGEWRPIKKNIKKKSTKISCYRCGRQGHYANTCYAKKHIKGYYLK
tara:strand:+ start:143 stop:892 length:750 start_codon:yes stop_codon:yes gene_type:complete